MDDFLKACLFKEFGVSFERRDFVLHVIYEKSETLHLVNNNHLQTIYIGRTSNISDDFKQVKRLANNEDNPTINLFQELRAAIMERRVGDDAANQCFSHERRIAAILAVPKWYQEIIITTKKDGKTSKKNLNDEFVRMLEQHHIDLMRDECTKRKSELDEQGSLIVRNAANGRREVQAKKMSIFEYCVGEMKLNNDMISMFSMYDDSGNVITTSEKSWRRVPTWIPKITCIDAFKKLYTNDPRVTIKNVGPPEFIKRRKTENATIPEMFSSVADRLIAQKTGVDVAPMTSIQGVDVAGGADASRRRPDPYANRRGTKRTASEAEDEESTETDSDGDESEDDASGCEESDADCDDDDTLDDGQKEFSFDEVNALNSYVDKVNAFLNLSKRNAFQVISFGVPFRAPKGSQHDKCFIRIGYKITFRTRMIKAAHLRLFTAEIQTRLVDGDETPVYIISFEYETEDIKSGTPVTSTQKFEGFKATEPVTAALNFLKDEYGVSNNKTNKSGPEFFFNKGKAKRTSRDTEGVVLDAMSHMYKKGI
jgi:hypothetical protein